MKGPLTNTRHERFANLVAGGMQLGLAYASAGFKGKGTAQSASRLVKKAPIAKRIAELQNIASTSAVTRASIDREWVISGLRNTAETAKSESSRVRAYELIGKAIGMFRDQSDHTFKWDGDISKLTNSQLDKLMTSLEVLAFNGDMEAKAKAEAEVMAELGPRVKLIQ